MATFIPLQTTAELDQLLARAKAEQWRELILLGPAAVSWYPDRLGDVTGYQWRGGEAGLAAKVARITSLTSLDLTGNNIGAEGAQALASLTALTSLNLSFNHIGDAGAQALASLTALTSLELRDNNIGAEGAQALAKLTALTSLNLWGNHIGDAGAQALAALTALTSLALRDNNIGAEGAQALASLTALTSLELRDNNIGKTGFQALLNAWSPRPNAHILKWLSLDPASAKGLPLPAEVIASGDAQAMLAAWRAFQGAKAKGQLLPLNEAKLLVVGSEAVGKTSLVRFLKDGEPRNPDEVKTAGAVIHERIETQQWLPGAKTTRVNLWDFGGQEILYGTHQFFLTKRSLYLLVLEDRREDDRSVYDWLNIIANRADESPVIVVINKSDDGKQMLQLEEARLRREHPRIVGIVRTSCNPDQWAAKSIAALKKLIVTTLKTHEALKDTRDQVPASWLWVKEQVTEAANQDNLLKLHAFETLCLSVPAEKKVSATDLQGEDDQRALLRLLHDLGVVVAHGLKKDDLAAKREIVLLNPNWLTNAIYKVLTSQDLWKQKGILRRENLREWLDPKVYPVDRHEFILVMMQEEALGLCFPLSSSEFLVPEGLPIEGPDYSDFWRPDCLRFRYRYKLLPRSLLPRFIVEAHTKLSASRTCWRTGGLFEVGQYQVLVSADRDKKVVEIGVNAVGGKGTKDARRFALNIIRNDLKRVHSQHGDLGVEAFVPLPGKPEVDESYDHLLTLEKKYGPQHTYLPRGADREYTVSELLAGVRNENHPGEEMNKQKPGDSYPAGEATVDVRREPDRGGEVVSGKRSWELVSVGTGIGAVLMVLLITVLPAGLRTWAAGLSTLFLVVTVAMLRYNPDHYYRHWLNWVIPLGPLAGLTLDISFTPLKIEYNHDASPFFLLAWVAVIAIFVMADRIHNKK